MQKFTVLAALAEHLLKGGPAGMRPVISEFSYGFALTNELISSPGMVLTAAPVFPSLFDEGRPGGGWDVRIQRPGIPLFLQFKLSECMTRSTCKEVRTGMNTPCYRMYLRSARMSRQHEMLLNLENSGQEVYYSAPAFHTPQELNAAFLGRNVRVRSVWIRPSDVGPLPDEKDHHVSFEPGGTRQFFSKNPKPLKARREFHDVAERLVLRVRQSGHDELRRDRLESLANTVEQIARKRRDIQSRENEHLQALEPLERVAYYASVFLESQLYVVQLNETA